MTDLELKVEIYAANNRAMLEQLLRLTNKLEKQQDTERLDMIFQELAEAVRNIEKARKKRTK